MLRCYNYDIVASEIPDEITLALNITGCPIHCEGCHSQWLWDATAGEPLTDDTLLAIIDQYGFGITCVAFMGGDNDPAEIARLAEVVRAEWPEMRLGWYSGRDSLPDSFPATRFNYIKLGPYIARLGGLDKPGTNQRLYRIGPDGTMTHLPMYKQH